MVHFFDALRVRHNGLTTDIDTREPGKDEPKVSQDATGSDSDDLSLEAQNEKELDLHPDQVTQNADTGVQKAEAAALVWPKWAVYATYAWYVAGRATEAVRALTNEPTGYGLLSSCWHCNHRS